MDIWIRGGYIWDLGANTVFICVTQTLLMVKRDPAAKNTQQGQDKNHQEAGKTSLLLQAITCICMQLYSVCLRGTNQILCVRPLKELAGSDSLWLNNACLLIT